MKKIALILVLFASTFIACERAIFEADKSSTDPFDNFEYLWNEIDLKYSYFELKNIDWDSIYHGYKSQLSADMSEEALFNVLGAMMNELRDDHSNLIAPFDVSRYNLPLQHEVNYYGSTVERNYIPNAMVTPPFLHQALAGGEIAYIRYGSFANPITEEALDFVINRYKNTKGLIIDVRSNGGGNPQNGTALLSRFTEKEVLAGNFITRNGKGRNDFGDKEPYLIQPSKRLKYLQPVIILIDRGSYSATTMFALAAKAFPSVRLMGDTTGGGGGLPNGGQLPNAWFYRFSISQMLDLQDKAYAEDGVPPDILAYFDNSNMNVDEIIEAALTELLK